MAEETRVPVLTLKNVTKCYKVSGENHLRARTFQAVSNVSLEVHRGETFGIVGESGCGKSTLAKLIMCLEKPDEGEILFQGQRIDQLPESERRKIRTRFQMVFQDSGSSLNPRKRVRDILSEPMRYHGVCAPEEIDGRIDELMGMVGLPVDMKNRYPHAFSGGQRQRICIARALSLQPDVIILDEPVSALDVSVQAQILNLLRDLQEKLHLTYVFIGHGLGAVHYMSHRVYVMYLGRGVELGESDELFSHPAHPYTRALLDAAPLAEADARDRQREVIYGEIDQAPPEGACPLYHRCPRATEECLHFDGTMKAFAPGHLASCGRAWEG